MNKASYYRQIAIGMISELYLPTPMGQNIDGRSSLLDRPLHLISGYNDGNATSQEVAHNILKLASLGRTDRWRKAIHAWAGLVIERGNTPDGLRSGFLQGIIFACHAA